MDNERTIVTFKARKPRRSVRKNYLVQDRLSSQRLWTTFGTTRFLPLAVYKALAMQWYTRAETRIVKVWVS